MTMPAKPILAPGALAPLAGLLMPPLRVTPLILALLMVAPPAMAQAPLRPMSTTAIEPALAKPLGEPMRAPRTTGAIDLKGKQFYIAEYLLLVDLSGEVPAAPRDGQLLGMPMDDGPAVLAYRTQHDIAALQALTDRAWADLQVRLAAAGVVLADAATLLREHGAVYEATDPASAPGAPVLLESRQGNTVRRYLALAPSGMRLVPRSAAGIGLGNLAARVAYPAKRIEGLSLAMAINLSALDTTGQRAASLASPGGLPTLSPLMELAPAPSAALVHAHAQLALVNLGEALVPGAAFARLRRAPMDGPIPSNDPLQPLISIGRRLLGEAGPQRVDALLELDGPATARLMVFLTSAANQAITDALKTAR
ncbi:MAG: hypothetical protein A3E25_01500 [Burkholderiales bacterium RIFCSPHIGHO2_12_FULL_69_20]|nr:MAG: hypothetical protein A3E25_01500 [Burkholderiales bacterium RIFCSPHIGHO2_12_FULL_69_20]